MTNMVIKAISLRKIINKIVFFVLSCLISTMICLVLWQIISRYALQNPSVFTEELVRFLLIWFGLLSAVYCFGAKNHVALTLLINKLSPVAQKNLSILHHSITLIFAIVFFIYGGTLLVNIVSMQVSSVLLISMGYVYIIFPFCGIMLAIYEVITIIELFYSEEEK